MVRHFLVLGLCLNLWLLAGAEQLYVRNKPFKGAMTRESGQLWVELKPLAEALGLTVAGDEQQGYLVQGEAESVPPGPGKVLVKGTEVATNAATGPLLVSLEQVAQVVGAKVIVNKSLGTVDVSLVATAPAAGSSVTLGGAAYTLIEYGVPGQAVSERMKPVFASVRSEFKNVDYRFCNAWNDADLKRYAKLTQSTDATYPAAFLVDREGKVLLQLRGGHVIEGSLAGSMRKLVDVNR